MHSDRIVCVLVATCVPGNACAETDSEANVCAWKATVQSSKDEEDDHRVIPRHDKYFADCRLRSKPASPSVILDLALVWDSSSRLVPKNFHLEICASPFKHIYKVLNTVK